MAGPNYSDLQAFFLVACERGFTRAEGNLEAAHSCLARSAGGASVPELAFSSIAL